MNRIWAPKTQVSVTDAGLVIKIELEGTRTDSLRFAFEGDQLCVRGRHDDFGAFESRIDVPSGYSRAKLQVIVAKGILRIEMPPGDDLPFFSNFPKSMLIYCNGCGKHFDIVITGKGPGNYQCPACGKFQVFDLEALVNQVMKQGMKMLGKKRRRR